MFEGTMLLQHFLVHQLSSCLISLSSRWSELPLNTVFIRSALVTGLSMYEMLGGLLCTHTEFSAPPPHHLLPNSVSVHNAAES